MKAKILLYFFFCLSCAINAEGLSSPSNLVVWSKDGTLVAFKLAEKPKVTFTETDFVITVQGVEVIYPRESLARFTYEDDTVITDITNLQTGEYPFKLNGESLLFPALDANSTVSVYSLNGSLIFKKSIHHNGEYALPISNLSTGIYLVKVNGVTYKIVIK